MASSALMAHEVGPNPFNLKRRLHLGPNYLVILYSPPVTRYAFELDLPPESYLEFGTGLIFDNHYNEVVKRVNSTQEGVSFLIYLEKDNRKWLIFQRFLKIPEEQESRTINFSGHRVVLPAKGGRYRLILETKESSGAFAFWSCPIIVPIKKEPTGIILISLDTLRADHLSCYGYERLTSPAIDRLASEGAIFTQATSTSNWTLPAHVSLFTSTYSPHHGVMAADDRIPNHVISLAEILSRNGFFCGAITGGGFVSPKYGFDRGFDYYNEAEGSVDSINSAELVFRAAKEWIEKNQDKDFFLFLHTYQIHSPYASPEPYRQTFLSAQTVFEEIHLERYLGGKGAIFRSLSEAERRNIIDLYDNEIRYTDEALIGPLLNWLKEKGLFDRLMIILTSDHGEEFYDHGAWVHGAHLYQESIRIPLIIKFPHNWYQGERIDQIVRITDIAPTILEVLGWKKSIPDNWHGQSLLPILEKKEKNNRNFLADSCWLSGDLCCDPTTGLPLSVATNKGQEKVIFNQPWNEKLKKIYQPAPQNWKIIEIYDLFRDKNEKEDLSQVRRIEIGSLFKNIESSYQLLRKLSRMKIELNKEELEKLRALGYIH
ncbi:MAG: sulfatase [Candidatus Aminicenantes bacterium]|nr:sulfatase [Candidatus Aminicenantes bacterium]